MYKQCIFHKSNKRSVFQLSGSFYTFPLFFPAHNIAATTLFKYTIPHTSPLNAFKIHFIRYTYIISGYVYKSLKTSNKAF